MKKDISLSDLISKSNIEHDYDPNAMSVEKARKWITNFLSPLEQEETIHIKDALHRILSKSVKANINVPNYDNSAMDGYAINIDSLKGEGPFSLQITGKVFAGNQLEGNANEAVRIMTGASIPAGLNAVIPQEHTETHQDVITCLPYIFFILMTPNNSHAFSSSSLNSSKGKVNFALKLSWDFKVSREMPNIWAPSA